MNKLLAAGVGYQPRASTAFVEPPVSAVPAPAVAPVAPLHPPVQAVAPQTDETVAVFLHLSSGERIWAGRFPATELAEQRAMEIVGSLNRLEPGVWARFGSRLIRPEAVVCIELAQRD